MREIYTAHSLLRTEIGDNLFDALAAIYPEGVTYPTFRDGRRGTIGNNFGFSLPGDDPRTGALLRVLEQNGYHPRNYLEPYRPPDFIMTIAREYGPEDLASALYLQPRPVIEVSAMGRKGGEPTGSLILWAGPEREEDPHAGKGLIQPHADILNAVNSDMVVSDRIRKMLEKADLRDIGFRATLLTDPDFVLPAPFWELTTRRLMPPLSPSNVLVGKYKEDYDGDVTKTWYLKGGRSVPEVLITNPELHYSCGDIQQMEPFDLARVRDGLGAGQVHYLVASQRFYQFCMAQRLNVDWQPVRVDAN